MVQQVFHPCRQETKHNRTLKYLLRICRGSFFTPTYIDAIRCVGWSDVRTPYSFLRNAYSFIVCIKSLSAWVKPTCRPLPRSTLTPNSGNYEYDNNRPYPQQFALQGNSIKSGSEVLVKRKPIPGLQEQGGNDLMYFQSATPAQATFYILGLIVFQRTHNTIVCINECSNRCFAFRRSGKTT